MKKSGKSGSGAGRSQHPGVAGRVPDLFVERLLLGELPQERRRQLEADPDVRRRLEELSASNREIMARYPVGEMARRIEERAQALKAHEAQERALREAREAREAGEAGEAGGARGAGGARRPFLRFAPVARLAVPAAGLAALVVVAGLLVVNLYPGFRDSVPAAAAQVEQTRLKGGAAHLVLYRQTSSGAEGLRDNDAARSGDVLQIGYVGAGSRYGVIVSLDGRGAVTVHYPTGGASSAALEPQGESLLSFAYELDDAPGFERFFLVSSDRQFPVETVVAAARTLAGEAGGGGRTGRLALPRHMQQATLVLLKKD